MSQTARTTRESRRKDVLQRLREEIALNRDFADEREAAFLSVVWTWLRVERAGRAFFNTYDITDAQFNALMILWDYRETRLRQYELAELLVVNRASMGGVLDRLERNGWVKRETDPHDRRAQFVHLTPQGIAKLKQVRTPYYRLLAAAFDQVERDALFSLIDFNDAFRARLAALADGGTGAAKPVRATPVAAASKAVGRTPAARTRKG